MPAYEVQAEGTAPHEYGDLLLSYLEQLGVEYVFGIPGGAIEPFYNALARSERRGGPRSITARHEAGSAFMADGYWRNSGKLGVCCATTGPGATNLITGVASAYENNVPMLVITAQTALSSFGKGAFQESSCTGVNTVELFNHCCRYSTLVSHPAQFEHKLTTAIMTAFAEPMGPVHLSIPVDVMRATPSHPLPRVDLPDLLRKPALFDSDAVGRLYSELKLAKNPLFVIGDGAGEAIGLILNLALGLNAQLVVTPHGKGLVSPYHPLFRGVIGFSGHQSAQQLLTDPEIDRIFIIGAQLSEWASQGWEPEQHQQRIIDIEASESNLTKTLMATLHVRGRLESIFEAVLKRFATQGFDKAFVPNDSEEPAASNEEPLRQFTLDDEDKFRSDASPIKPQRLMRELANIFPANTHYLADVGASFSWATHYLHPHDRRVSGRRDAKGGLFRATLNFAAMGWAIGSAIGTALARPDKPVVCITGDGSLLMNGQEITVAVEEKLPVVFVVLNDSAYGMVKHGQRMTGAEEIAFSLPMTNFAAFAEAMGVEGHIIHSAEELLKLDCQAFFKKRGPTLLDVRIDQSEAPPIGMRTKALKQNT
ncbi:MAG: thiamine pyrophosphate-binding protein [Gammaproteobacteria bacterium]|nr:thiamine pyrophosphate-binding protein [Gammaproteobacteria bacterium]MBQ0839159.1 thiamine pyrophosphate-binding protein [Gammaproteobacteria bacterium]